MKRNKKKSRRGKWYKMLIFNKFSNLMVVKIEYIDIYDILLLETFRLRS